MRKIVIDPAGCECSDCGTGMSSPLDRLISFPEAYSGQGFFNAIWNGDFINRSGKSVHRSTDNEKNKHIAFGENEPAILHLVFG